MPLQLPRSYSSEVEPVTGVPGAPFVNLADKKVWVNGVDGVPVLFVGARFYQIGMQFDGVWTNNQKIFRYPCGPILFRFSNNFENSMGFLFQTPTGVVSFDILVNTDVVGDMTFAAGEQFAIFTQGTEPLELAEQDVLSVRAPASGDATAADLTFYLVGERI